MKKYFLFLFLALNSIVFADSEMGCSISEILKTPKNSLLKNMEENNCTETTNQESSIKVTNKTAITEKLRSVKVLHESEEVLIERAIISERTCPPFCIEPMNIKDVLTIAELEVLAFIDKLKEKKARLLIDVREGSFYAEGTIPGAINLPFSMLKSGSKYQEEVLKLLGAKVDKKSVEAKGSKLIWSFKNAQSLLIFANDITSSEASDSIKELLKLGYPSSKLLYYRAGFISWKALGLSIR